MVRITKDGIKAASATYRRATNKVAKKLLKIEPMHTKHPSEDFEIIVGLAEEKIEERILKWYRRGIVKGLRHAIDFV